MTADNQVVRDFIVPIYRYPHLRESQTLSEVVKMLLSYTCGGSDRLRYSGMLVISDENKLVGYLNLQAILNALDNRLTDMPKGFEGKIGEFPNLTFLWEDSFFSKCSEKKDIPISDFMIPIKKIVKGGDPLLKALSIMLQSGEVVLPVIEEEKIIGVIRLEEIFTAICTACKL